MIRPSQIDEASFEVRLKAKACECHEVDNHTVYVIPHDQTKDRRAVIWLLEGILCVSTDGGAVPGERDRKPLLLSRLTLLIDAAR